MCMCGDCLEMGAGLTIPKGWLVDGGCLWNVMLSRFGRSKLEAWRGPGLARQRPSGSLPTASFSLVPKKLTAVLDPTEKPPRLPPPPVSPGGGLSMRQPILFGPESSFAITSPPPGLRGWVQSPKAADWTRRDCRDCCRRGGRRNEWGLAPSQGRRVIGSESRSQELELATLLFEGKVMQLHPGIPFPRMQCLQQNAPN